MQRPAGNPMDEVPEELKASVIEGIAAERRLRGLSAAQRLQGLTPEQILEHFSAEQILEYLSGVGWWHRLSREQVVRLREILGQAESD